MEIRLATIQDYDSVCRLFDELDDFHVAARPDVLESRVGHGRPRASVEAALADPDATIVVAEVDGEVVGFVWVLMRTITRPSFRAKRVGVVDALGVQGSRRGQGSGRALMAAAEDWARGRGADEVQLEVFDFEGSAVGFYQRLGYGTLMRRMSKPLTSVVR